MVALDGCSFSVSRGRVLGFLGRNGAGKTTAMRGVFGLLRLDGGRVLWLGRSVTREDRARFGYLPEERGLYPRMGVADQLVFFGRLRGLSRLEAQREALEWLERLGLAARAEASLDTLSHGNQQRVQLAVSLMGRPELLVLDEPFSGLDPIAAATLASVIEEEARRGAAVVFSSHQLELVEDVCDDIAIITHGRVVLEGPLEGLKRASSVRYVAIELASPPTHDRATEIAHQLGGQVVEANAAFLRLRVPAPTRPATALAALEKLGRVEQFRFEPPRLDDIFREAAGE